MKTKMIVMLVVAALVGAVVNEVDAGRLRGRGGIDTCVAGHRTDVYHETFRGGESAMITVSGDGDTDLDLYVYDENDNLVESDTDFTDECLVTFTPRWTGQFRIEVKNRGRVYNCYELRTN